MTTDPQHLLPAHVPWYKKRIFWGVIFSLFFTFSTVLFISFLDKNGGDYSRSFNQVFDSLNLAYGAIVFMLYGFKIGTIYGYIGSAIYFTLIPFLAYKTLQNPRVILRYPVILSILYISGIVLLSGLNGF